MEGRKMKPSFLLGRQQQAYFQWQTVGFSQGMEGMCFKWTKTEHVQNIILKSMQMHQSHWVVGKEKTTQGGPLPVISRFIIYNSYKYGWKNPSCPFIRPFVGFYNSIYNSIYRLFFLNLRMVHRWKPWQKRRRWKRGMWSLGSIEMVVQGDWDPINTCWQKKSCTTWDL